MKSTCKDCTERYIGCHGKCEKYLQVVKEAEELRKKKFEEKFIRYNCRGKR